MLSVIIPSRNEQGYLEKTIENVLKNSEGKIEILVILDGWIPNPQLSYDDRVIFIHNKESIGQRQGINQAAKMAKGKYIMKLDAHCAVAKGFDVILARDCEYDMTMIPRMYNLNVVDWTPKLHKRTDYMYISSLADKKPFRATYYGSKQPKNDKMIDDTMCCMGPCFFMHKDRFWELGGCDEGHGGWGQQGIEVACKAWLSGGRLVVNKNTWFAHWFRGGGVPEGHKKGFPYSLSQEAVNKARKYSQDLWLNNKWDKQVRNFNWMVDKFNPPSWNEMTIIYYTDDTVEEPLKSEVKQRLKDMDIPVIEVSNEGKKRSIQQMYKNILKGCKHAKTKYVGLAEHDCLYEKEHFLFKPKKDDTFYYNTNHLFLQDNKYYRPGGKRKAMSQLVCDRKLLINAVKQRIKDGYTPEKGKAGATEFGVIDNYKMETFETKKPNIDVRTKNSFTGRKRGIEVPPPGAWYQESTINGIKMPTRRNSDTNQKRWEKFIKPLVKKGSGTFTDLGANAGFYCRKMIDLGYTAIGVERDKGFIAHAKFWEDNEPKGTRIVESDINDYKLVCSQYVLMANIHYWLTPYDLGELKKQLDAKALNVILIGRYKTLGRHASPCTLEFLQGLFADWEEVEVIHDKKHFSIMFKNPNLFKKSVDEITFYQPFMKSKKFLPAYNDYIDKILSGKKFNTKKTDYFKYLEWRKFKNKGRLLKRHTELITSMRDEGMREPITLGRIIDGKQDNNILKDGDHRLIVAKKLGIKNIIYKIN